MRQEVRVLGEAAGVHQRLDLRSQRLCAELSHAAVRVLQEPDRGVVVARVPTRSTGSVNGWIEAAAALTALIREGRLSAMVGDADAPIFPRYCSVQCFGSGPGRLSTLEEPQR